MCNVIVTKHLHLALCTLPQNMPCTVLLSQRNRLTRELREFNFESGLMYQFIITEKLMNTAFDTIFSCSMSHSYALCTVHYLL